MGNKGVFTDEYSAICLKCNKMRLKLWCNFVIIERAALQK